MPELRGPPAYYYILYDFKMAAGKATRRLHLLLPAKARTIMTRSTCFSLRVAGRANSSPDPSYVREPLSAVYCRGGGLRTRSRQQFMRFSFKIKVNLEAAT